MNLAVFFNILFLGNWGSRNLYVGGSSDYVKLLSGCKEKREREKREKIRDFPK